MPSGVHSKTQARTSAGTKPGTSRMINPRSTLSGTSNKGSTVSATCASSQAETM
jgi:hypothetical protein